MPENTKPRDFPEASIVPGTGLEPARPKAQPPEDCASTNFATRVGYRSSASRRERIPASRSMPLSSAQGGNRTRTSYTNTCPSNMPVYQFQHLGRYFVIPLGLEPRTLSLKVRCSNRLSYEIPRPAFGAAKIEEF